MKKTFLSILIGITSIPSYLSAQVLTQDSKGTSSTLVQGGVLGLDAGETALGVSYNNLIDSDIFKTNVIWGFSAIGKNEKGLASLLDGGHFQPEAKIDALVGLRWVNKKARAGEKLASKVDSVQIIVNSFRSKFNADVVGVLEVSLDAVFAADTNSHILDLAEHKASLAEARGKLSPEELLAHINAKYKDSKDSLLIRAYSLAKNEIERLYVQLTADLSNEENIKNGFANQVLNDNSSLITSIFFIRPGIRSSFFYLYQPIDTVDLMNNFQKTFYTGFYMDIGLNVEAFGWLWGGTLGFQQANSIEYMSDQKYTVKAPVSNSSSGQQQTYQKDFNAYSGSYVDEWQFTLKTDAIKYVAVGKNTLAINPYFRVQNGKTLPKIQTLGVGGYFFKQEGPFVLGLYLEAYDLSNNVYQYTGELKVPSFSDRLKFGIITKLTLSSILGSASK